MKKPHPGLATLESQTEEFNLLSSIPPHKHILPMLGGVIDYTTQQLWLVSPFQDGGSLEAKMARDRNWFDDPANVRCLLFCMKSGCFPFLRSFADSSAVV